MLSRTYCAFRLIYRRASSAVNSLLSQEDTRNSTMKAYCRTKSEDRVDIQFQYVDPVIGLDRWFNFNRSMDDNVQQIKERIVTNIDKACLKYKKKKLKKLPTDPLDELKLEVQLLQGCEIIGPEVTCRNLLIMPDVVIAVNGQLYHLDVDPPTVKTLKLPTSIMAGYQVYLSKFEVEYCITRECELIWYKSHEPVNVAPEDSSETWVQVGTGFSYSTSNSDIGSWLKVKCIPRNSSRVGLPECAISSQVVEAGPGQCPFDIRHNFTKESMGNTG
jgi:2',5'-phosphodiesterase